MVIEDSVLVVVMWAGEVLHARNLLRGQRFVLGEAEDAWPFPVELLGARSLALVDYTGKRPCWCPTGQRLTSGQCAATDIGGFRIMARGEPGEREKLPLRAPAWLKRDIAYFGSSALAISMTLIGACYSVPKLTDVPSLSSGGELTFAPIQFLEEAIVDSEEDEHSPTPASEVYPSRYALTGNSRDGRDTRMGMPRKDRVGMYGILGPPDNPDPHVSRYSSDGTSDGCHGLGMDPTRVASDKNAPTVPWGRDTSLGTNEVSARGHMWDDTIGEALGVDSSDTTHLDGGEMKIIEAERATADNRPARVVHTQLKAKGALPTAAIELSLVSKLEKVRGCYRADPASRGTEEERIDVLMSIDKDGNASAATATQAEYVAPATVQCILDQLKAARFPAADAATNVVYPLVFIPGKTLAQLATPHRSEPPGCQDGNFQCRSSATSRGRNPGT